MSYGPYVYHKVGGNELVIASGGQLTVQSGGKVALGTDTAAGLVLGGGTSSFKVSSATAGNFLQFYFENTATSGTSRGMYLRLYHNAAGVDGEALRAFTTVQKAMTGGVSVHGAHVSINFDTSGSVDGQLAALRATLHVPNRAATGGIHTALEGEIFLDGNSADISGVRHSILRLAVVGGNSTAQDLVVNAIDLGASDGSGKMIYSHSHAEGNAAGSIRVLINGTAKYLKFWDAE